MTDPNAPAGWYPDVHDLTRLQYWDGAAWTDNYAPAATPTPTPTPPARRRLSWLKIAIPVVVLVIALAVGIPMIIARVQAQADLARCPLTPQEVADALGETSTSATYFTESHWQYCDYEMTDGRWARIGWTSLDHKSAAMWTDDDGGHRTDPVAVDIPGATNGLRDTPATVADTKTLDPFFSRIIFDTDQHWLIDVSHGQSFTKPADAEPSGEVIGGELEKLADLAAAS